MSATLARVRSSPLSSPAAWLGFFLAVATIGQRLELGHPVQQPAADPGRVLEMFGALAGELDDGLDQGGLGGAEVLVVAVERFHHLARELEGLGAAEQHDVPFDAEPETVVGHDPAGVGVVRGDLGFQGVGAEQPGGEHLVLGVGRGDALQRGQLGADAGGQLPGGFPGEGHTEHFLRPDPAVGDEPHHAVGHGGGLARAGAGNDEPGRQRRGNDVRLFGGGAVLLPQHGGELLGGEPRQPAGCPAARRPPARRDVVVSVLIR